MKLHFQNQNQQQGGVLIVTIFIASIVGIALGSYLLLVRSQDVAVVRSQAWNSALAMAEAGAEEAMAQLNPGAASTTLTVDRTANGWHAPSGGVYGPMSRNLTNGSYSVIFTDVQFPIIYSTGYTTLPDLSATVSRVVRVATTNIPLFSVSLAARTNITMTGNGVSTDSFDSSNSGLSTNGHYDSSKTSTNGDVASLYGTVNLGGHGIEGNLYLGPTATLNGNGSSVSGKVYTDFNTDFPQVVPPNTTGWINLLLPPLLPTVVNGVAYTYAFFNSGDYVIPNMSGGSVYVGTNATVRLSIQAGSSGDVRIGGTGSNAGKLTMYVAAASFSISGNSVVDGGSPANLSYYGLASNTSLTFSGNAAFTGTIYAPSASLTLNGSGSSTYDVMGSVIASSVTIHGNFMFHYDQNLDNAGPSRGYLATDWSEL